MADTFEITAVVPMETLDDGLRIVATIEASAFTKPHGVNFTASVPKVAGWREALIAAVAAEAAELEAVFEA